MKANEFQNLMNGSVIIYTGEGLEKFGFHKKKKYILFRNDKNTTQSFLIFDDDIGPFGFTLDHKNGKNFEVYSYFSLKTLL